MGRLSLLPGAEAPGGGFVDRGQEEVALVNGASHLSPFPPESETGGGKEHPSGSRWRSPWGCAKGRGPVGAAGGRGRPCTQRARITATQSTDCAPRGVQRESTCAEMLFFFEFYFGWVSGVRLSGPAAAHFAVSPSVSMPPGSPTELPPCC